MTVSGILTRSACRSCQLLQNTSVRVKGWRPKIYKNQPFFTHYYISTSIHDTNKTAEQKKSNQIFDTVVQERSTAWMNIEDDIADIETFEFVKQQYMERMQELELEKLSTNELVVDEVPPVVEESAVVIKKKKKKRNKPLLSKYVRGNQLSYQGEQNVLAELDIYIYLGQIKMAVNLFNYHRRHGHKFNIDAYNKLIHAWAAQKGWKNIQLLLGNMRNEDVSPNYQTYAALLEACGNLDNVNRTEYVISEMEQNGFDVHQVLRRSKLSKQQILSILKAVEKLYPNFLNKTTEPLIFNGTSANQHIENKEITGLINSQIDAEMKGSVNIQSIDKTKIHSSLAMKRSKLYTQITEQWRNDFITEIVQARKVKNNRAFVYNRCITFSSVLSPEELADIVFENVIPIIASQTQGVPVNFICRLLGQMIYSKFCSNFKYDSGVVEKVHRIVEQYCQSEDWSTRDIQPRSKWLEISEKLPHLATEDLIPNPWPTKVKAMVRYICDDLQERKGKIQDVDLKVQAASVLLDILKKVTTIDTSLFLKSKMGTVEHSLSHFHEFIGHQRVGILKFHPTVGRLYSSYLSQLGNITFQTNKLPVVIPPRPWTGATSGAYLLLHTDFVRTLTGQYQMEQLSVASDNGDIDRIFDSLNYLGNCAWKVNQPVLDIMIQLFNEDGNPKLDIIGHKLPHIEQRKCKGAMTSEERKSRQRQRKLYHELFALRMDQLYKLSVAHHFRDKVFWVPNNLDFRGRLYPVAPHCSHIGNDLSRSLLMFADGKKLGKNGLDWLKVHLVNVHGHLKKSSLQERIAFVDEHLDVIFDSADQPLTGSKWWQDGSDPWQTLVACIELTNAIRSGDPENYVSHMPVHQDGSCNGLQHYAGLGRDEYGARQVNLMPADKPQDVYLEVANLVEKARVRDAKTGNNIAHMLEGKITRKVVKQTVMTVVYGVTFVGGRLQIEKQLKELDVEADIIFKASVYVVQEVFKSLTEMFTSARQIQDWLTVSAAQIALTGNCVDWVTPLGLPVVQPYHRETVESISTPLQRVASRVSYDYTQVPNLTKQKGGFPPNFVHSLDSTHLMMTALRCQDEKMTFASVHDSFWTHAQDIDKMNIFCREEFVALHELPILETLKKHFDDSYAGKTLRKPLNDGCTTANFGNLPKQGTFDIKKVLESVYFFS